MAKFFKLKKEPYIVVTFAQWECFLKTLAMYNCRGLPAFKCQRYRVYWSSNQKLLHYYQHARTVQKICSVYQIICEILNSAAHFIHSLLRKSRFQGPKTKKAMLIFDHGHSNIFRQTFNFHESVSACKKSGFFIILFQI